MLCVMLRSGAPEVGDVSGWRQLAATGVYPTIWGNPYEQKDPGRKPLPPA